jgi:hypothetical protein
MQWVMKILHRRKKPERMERSTENGHCTFEDYFLVAAQGHHINLANIIIDSITAGLVRVFVPAVPIDLRVRS